MLRAELAQILLKTTPFYTLSDYNSSSTYADNKNMVFNHK